MCRLVGLKAVLVLSMTISFSAYSKGYIERSFDARSKCGLQNLAQPKYEAPEESMKKHYQPSNLQRVLTPVYSGIFDHFGGIVQGMISGQDEAYVKPTLKRLGREISRYAQSNPMSTEQKICMATCMVHHLMEPGDPTPWSSMELANARGVGFCRHFSMTTKYILKYAGIEVDTETALDHMFLKIKLGGILHYQDPMNEDGQYSCTFFPADSVY